MTKMRWENAELEAPKTMSEQVYNLLREKIMNQEIMPGEVLLEVEVSKALGVSRTPVREAFRLLQHDDLVSRNPRGGVSVTELTMSDLREVSDLRLVFEVHAIERTCDRITDEELEELEATVIEVGKIFERAGTDEDLDLVKLGELNTKFHDILYQAAGSNYLTRILETIRLPILRYRPFSLETKKQRDRSWQEHKLMIQYLRNHDKTSLKKLVKKHIKDAGDAIARKLDKLSV
jgi:DNA-binding GntR family transcriptional regulator